MAAVAPLALLPLATAAAAAAAAAATAAASRRMRKLDLASVCLPVRVRRWLLLPHNSHNKRTFIPAVIGLIATIRDGQPTTPIVVTSPIFSTPR